MSATISQAEQAETLPRRVLANEREIDQREALLLFITARDLEKQSGAERQFYGSDEDEDENTDAGADKKTKLTDKKEGGADKATEAPEKVSEPSPSSNNSDPAAEKSGSPSDDKTDDKTDDKAADESQNATEASQNGSEGADSPSSSANPMRNAIVEASGRAKPQTTLSLSARQKRQLSDLALKKYQRAARLDPQPTISMRVIELACLKERYNVANRYVNLMKEFKQPINRMDPMLLRHLAVGLAQSGQLEKSYELYKIILGSLENQFTPQAVLLHAEGAKYAYASGDFRQASDSFEFVYRAAKHEQEFGLSPRLIDLLEIEKAPTIRMAADAFLLDKRYDRAAQFFETADALDRNTPLLAFHRARIAVAQNDFSAGYTWLTEALEGDLSGEGDNPLTLLFKIAGQLKKEPQAQAALDRLVNKVEQKIQKLELKSPLKSGTQKFYVQLDDNASRSGSSKIANKNGLSKMDADVWNFYCQRLYDQGKTEQALAAVRRFQSVQANLGALSLELNFSLSSQKYADAIALLANLNRYQGDISLLEDSFDSFLQSPEHRKSLIEAAFALQKQFTDQLAAQKTKENATSTPEKAYQQVSQSWSIYHAGAVGQGLLSRMFNEPGADPDTTSQETDKPGEDKPGEVKPEKDKSGEVKSEQDKSEKDGSGSGGVSENPEKEAASPTDLILAQAEPFLKFALDHAPEQKKAKSAKPSVGTLIQSVGSWLNRKSQQEPTEPSFNSQGIALLWGISLIQQEKWEQALAVWEQGKRLASEASTKRQFDFYICGALAGMNRQKEALKIIDQCLKDEPNDTDYLSRKAWLLYVDNQWEASSVIYEKILDKYDSRRTGESLRLTLKEVRSLLAALYDKRAVIAESEGRLEEQKDFQSRSQELLEQALDEYPSDVGALNDLAYFWSVQKKNLYRAMQMSQRAVNARPDSAAYLDTLAWIHFQRGETDLARQQLEKAVKMEQDPTILEHLGDVYFSQKRPADAQSLWQRAFEAMDKPINKEKYVQERENLTRKMEQKK